MPRAPAVRPVHLLALGFLVAAGCGNTPVQLPDVPDLPVATDIPLTPRPHMDVATLAVYNRIRARQAWLLGVGVIGTAANPFFTVPESQTATRWTELYGDGAGLPSSREWEMAERSRPSAARDWISLKAFAEAGGLPWIVTYMNNFTVAFGPGTPPAGGMNDTRGGAAGVLVAGAANDAFVAYVRQLAREVKAVGKPVVFRPFPEGNAGWFWWGGNAKDFKDIWRRTFEIFQQEGARNVIWLWAASDNCEAQCNIAGFYPGDDVVDILAVDAYFTGDVLPASTRTALNAIAALGLDKPIMFGELGPAASAAFWQQAPVEMATIPRFRGFSLWLARGWRIWGGSPGAGSLIDASTPLATRAAFDAFVRHPRVLGFERWLRPD
jgi:hypothetical protein